MASPSPRFLFLFLILLPLFLAQNLAGPQYLDCPCSPTRVGYRLTVLDDLQNAVQQLRDDVLDWKSNNLAAPEIARLTAEGANAEWNNCVSSHSYEECVNADAALRVGTCKPNCASLCFYDRRTWLNIVNGKPMPGCDTSASYKSVEPDLLDGPEPGNDVRRPAVNPNATATTTGTNSNSARPTITPPARSAQGIGTSPVTNADSNPVSEQNGAVTAEGTPQPTVEVDKVIESSTSKWEGCVAVEHLQGYVLQHRKDLRRSVLCANGFCATDNHGIIVDGVLTSMKQLCEGGKWQCVRSVKWVNNLKLAANRRAVVNDIVTVTPYDVRFPKFAVWFVQMAEDLINFLAVAAAAGWVTAVALVLSVKFAGKGMKE